MKNKLTKILILLFVFCTCLTMYACSCSNGAKMYYLYEDGELVQETFVSLDGEKWLMQDNSFGFTRQEGTSIVLYDNTREKILYSGTLNGDILTIKKEKDPTAVDMVYKVKGSTDESGNKYTSESGIVTFNGATLIEENKFYMELSVGTDAVSIKDKIIVPVTATWRLYKGSTVVKSKTLSNMSNGLNNYSIVVKSGDWTKKVTYQFSVFKNYLVPITYKSIGSADIVENVSTHTTLGNGPSVTREGYTFVTWGCAGHYVERAVTFNATWTPNQYTVAFNSNGGQSQVITQEFTYDVAQSLRRNTFTKPGNGFKGWATSKERADAEIVDYTNEQSVKNLATSGTVTLYATWQPAKYTIAFNSNGATGSMQNQGFVYGVSQTLTDCAFEKAGYTFIGWAESANGTVKYTNEHNILDLTDEDGKVITLYAIWQANTYTIKFNANDGVGEMDDMSMTYDVAKNLNVNLLSRAGYSFIGWAINPDGSTVYSNKELVKNLTTENNAIVTLYAVWEANTNTYYRVNHWQESLDQTSEISTMRTVKDGVYYDLKSYENKQGTTDTLTEGFANSYVGFEAQNIEQINIDGDGSAQLGVYYTRLSYQLTTVKTSDAIVDFPQGGTYKYGQRVSLSATVKVGYTFIKWVSSDTQLLADRLYSLYEFNMPNGDVTLTANVRANANTPYVVNHLTESLDQTSAESDTRILTDGVYYDLALTVTNRGTTDTLTQISANTYVGFTVKPFEQVNIDGDGSAVLNIYYERQSFTITAVAGTGITYVSGSNTYKYGATVTVVAHVKAGYTWTKWTSDDASALADYEYTSYTFTMPLANVTLTASAVANENTPYKVEHYQQNVESGYTVVDTETLLGTTDTLTQAVAKSYVGFTSQYFSQRTINGNGTTVIKIYYTRHAYTLNFYANNENASGEMSSQTFKYGEEKAISACGFSVTAYDFAGWATEIGGGKVYDNEQLIVNLTVENGASFDLYAIWTPTVYDITYNLDGGKKNTQLKYTITSTPLTITDATKDGYEFIGWTNDQITTPTKNVVVAQGTYGNLSFTANWQVRNDTEYTVKTWQESLDQTSGQSATRKYLNNTYYDLYLSQIETGTTDTQTNVVAPTLEGFDALTVVQTTILGNGSAVVDMFYDRHGYTIAFNNGGGTGDMASISVKYNQNVSLPNCTFANGALNFLGWATTLGEEAIYLNNQTVTNLTAEKDGTVTLYAVWTDKQIYYVSYNGNGATGGNMVNSVHIYDESSALSTCVYAKTGYEFVGWSYNGTTYADGEDILNLSSELGGVVELTAIWTPATYTIAYSANGGEGTMSTVSAVYDQAIKLDANAFTKPSSTFVGWALETDGEVVYKNGETVTNLATGGTVTLYAVWM